ncbi:metal-dependent hydrolase [Halorubrum ezzemoulense]|uniref:metal-dependent hydrolase n=1 Tax=Halorubrum ezzemoulense TaxID=337243 RepID=UPI00232DDA8E|nr:metal-dependent hydrolase [Halorubrum ezzemoulense]MDB9281676.1 metal-dependent hydrolase [Halorubrum ezzemoulense]MDB9285158.1 metal-dependent hydrolase [Halorubrum ezzemoulense]
MFPLGHLAVAYLSYVVYAAATTHRLPARLALIPVAVGSQFPDLVDKPLAYVGVLTSGRSLAHSVFTFAVCSVVVWWVAIRLRGYWRPDSLPDRLRSVTPVAFAVGYVSHLGGDSYHSLLIGDVWSARFLVYPIYDLPRSPASDIAPWTRMFRIYREMGTHPQLNLILVAVGVFVGLRLREYLETSHNK